MQVLYSEHPAMFRNNPLFFILAVLLIAAFGLGIIILLWWYLKCKALKLEVTDSEIVLEQGLLSKTRSEIGFSSVRTVKVYQSFFNRLFGTGTIELFTAGDQPEIVARGMPEPNRIRDLIKDRELHEA